MNLERAVAEGSILNDVIEFAALSLTAPGLTTYRGMVRCTCGTPVLLHVEVLWRGKEPALLHAAISGEHCPDCATALSPSTATYVGLYSPGWPRMPATAVNITDLYHAMALLEREKR